MTLLSFSVSWEKRKAIVVRVLGAATASGCVAEQEGGLQVMAVFELQRWLEHPLAQLLPQSLPFRWGDIPGGG